MVFLEHRASSHAAFGAAGVYLFFVLSGFLIFGILRRERAKILDGRCTAGEAWKCFMISRTLRIFPIYYMAIAGVWLLHETIAGGLTAPGELLSCLTFTSDFWIGFVHHQWTPALSHFWSLAVEEQFYLLAAPIVLFGLLSARRLCGWFALINIVAFTMFLTAGASIISLGTNPVINFGLFAMGGSLHELDTEKWKKRTNSAAVAVLCMLFVGLPWAVGASMPIMAINAVMWLGGLLMAALVFTVSLHQKSAMVRLLEWSPIAGLGRISYGFYVYHYILSPDTLRLMTGGRLELMALSPAFRLVVLFAITALVSILSWTLIEAPALKLKTRLLRERRERTSPLPSAGQQALA